jgi:putative solute:sodium symporter small subunit
MGRCDGRLHHAIAVAVPRCRAGGVIHSGRVVMSNKSNTDAYWRANLRLMAILLSVWFAVSFGAGVLFADALDSIRFFGFKLGFWFAQQGSIYVFVLLIFVYVWQMNKIEREHDVHED